MAALESAEGLTEMMENNTIAEGSEDAAAAAEAAAKKKRDKKKRNKANKKKGEAADEDRGGDDGDDADHAAAAGAADPKQPGGVPASQLTQQQLYEMMAGKRADAGIKDHKFWDTQPVPKQGELVSDTGPLVVQTVDEIRKEPYPLAGGLDWSVVDMLDEAQCSEVYTLLTENYVEDDDAMFRFDYSLAFLTWALTPPGFDKELHLGVRAANGRLLAFISGVPAKMRVHEKAVPMVEINFLCVHKKLRSKRLAPVLIKEITRRVNVNGVFQAVYTAGVVLPSPVANCRYWHRSLNPKKLCEIGFSRVGERMNMSRTIKLYKLPEEPQIPGLQAMRPEHVKSACKLLNDYLLKSKLAPVFNEAEFGHMLLPRPGVVDSFVLVDPKSGLVTDLCSFYHLPSSVMKVPKYDKLNAAYSFYNVATSVPLPDLMRDLLIMAKKVDMDVFNALDVMENETFLKDLKFGIGDGHLQYYLYNYKCPTLQSSDIGLVLL